MDQNSKLHLCCYLSYGTIENCTNEAEKSEFIGAILLGVVSTFEAEDKIKMCREYPLSGINGKGRLDFNIKQGEDILCIIEAKSQNIEHGFVQNFVQLQVACQVIYINYIT